MQEKELRFWPDFVDEVDRVVARYPGKKLLFRGISSSNWKLTTTLERSGCKDMSFGEYCRLLAFKIKPALETFSGRKWSVPDVLPPGENFLDPELLSLRRFPSQELYSYMIFLRHYGFPSPLLDWTYSPFVAAFFAFRHRNDAECRSIYIYCERPTGLKFDTSGVPKIHPIGPYVSSHPRHFRQQSDYTICGSLRLDGWHFSSHDEVFSKDDTEQDFLWKCTLPSSERTKVLRVLNYYNLNSYSLFDSEESLLETLWFNEYDSTLHP